MQFVTRRRKLDIALPPGAVWEQSATRLLVIDRDGNPASRVPAAKPAEELPVAASLDNGVLTVSLPATIGASRCVLSLRYHIPGPGASLQGSLPLPLPRFPDGAWISQMYWQLLLPAEKHLLRPPDALTCEYAWRWNGFYCGRQPAMGPAELDAWVGLPEADGEAAEAGMNSYLFSSLGWPESCEIVTANRSTIVLLASGTALLGGLALIYLRAARHPALLLGATVLLAGVAVLYPDWALMAAQSAALGVVLALLALVLRQWLSRPYPAIVPDAETMSLLVPRSGQPPGHPLAPHASSRVIAAPPVSALSGSSKRPGHGVPAQRIAAPAHIEGSGSAPLPTDAAT